MNRWLMLTVCCGGLAGGEVLEPASGTVPPTVLGDYFDERPQRFLVDPQRLLSPKVRREREAFLDYHSKDSEIDFYVLLFARGQEIPDGIRVEELAERFFGEGRAALLALYFLGEPERTRVLLSPTLAGAVGSAQLAGLRRQAVEAGAGEGLESDQLEAFCVQMAIGIYGIERAAGLVSGPGVGPMSGEATAVGTPPAAAQGPLDRWRAALGEGGLPAAVLGGTVLVALGFRRLRLRRAVFEFPQAADPGRLGAHAGAGVGCLMSFASATESPSDQQPPTSDSLGNL